MRRDRAAIRGGLAEALESRDAARQWSGLAVREFVANFDSVIQGAQYGVRTGRRGGFLGTWFLENVYEEVGGCSNPAGMIGEAGIIAQGGKVRFRETWARAGRPLFANTGTTEYRYYVVASSATFGPSNVMQVGSALTNGSGNITVTTPDIAGAASFDLLRVTYPATERAGPYGTGNYAVATGVTRGSACVSGVCTFTDTQATLSSYTVATPTYFPLLTIGRVQWYLGPMRIRTRLGECGDPRPRDARSGWHSVTAELGSVAPAVIAQACIAHRRNVDELPGELPSSHVPTCGDDPELPKRTRMEG